MIGYKLLTPAGKSISSTYGRVTYPLDGAWIEVQGRGAFVGHSLPGLLRGGFGPLLAECECEERIGGDAECTEYRRVRVIRTATIDLWTLVRVAICTARDVAHLSTDPRVMAAIEAAERCERERTIDSARAAKAAAVDAVEAAVEAVEAVESVEAWAAVGAAEAAALVLVAWAVEAWAVAWAVAWSVADAVEAASSSTEARTRILGYLVAEAWGGAV